MSRGLQQKRVFAAEFEKVFGDFFTAGSYAGRGLGLGLPNKSGEKSFDIKIASPSRRPTNKLFFRSRLIDLMTVLIIIMIMMILPIILVITMMMRAVVVEQINSCSRGCRQNTEHRAHPQLHPCHRHHHHR